MPNETTSVVTKRKVFYFERQNRIGKLGESHFLSFYQFLPISRADGRKYDFTLDGQLTVELKTDTWLMSDSPNIFVELYSNAETETYGGIHRAKHDGVDFFVYYFINNGIFLWYDVEEMYSIVCENLDRWEMKTIVNPTYKSHGLLVLRCALESALVRWDKFVKKP